MSTIGADRIFAKHIRDYYGERLGVRFHERSFGFVGYKIDGTDLWINEFYAEPNTSFFSVLRMVKEVIQIGKQQGCIRLLGCNETTLQSYQDIRTLHTWFKMVQVGRTGTREIWARMI